MRTTLDILSTISYSKVLKWWASQGKMLLTESSMVRSRISPPINTMATESLYNNIDFVVDVLMIPLSCCHVVVSRRKNPAVLFFFARPHFSCFVGFPQTCDPLQGHSAFNKEPLLPTSNKWHQHCTGWECCSLFKPRHFWAVACPRPVWERRRRTASGVGPLGHHFAWWACDGIKHIWGSGFTREGQGPIAKAKPNL